MMFEQVNAQLNEVIRRSISASICTKQNFPQTSTSREVTTLGDLRSTAIAMKDIPYENIYNDLNENNQYHLKLQDGGLLLFQYKFDAQGLLLKHRLAYFPCPVLPTHEEAPELYDKDILYGDIIQKRIVRFPIRFDYDPRNYKPSFHPHSHMTLGQFENCRIPVTQPVSPDNFLRFILRNFYHLFYRKHQNTFEKKMAKCSSTVCLTTHEKNIPHMQFI